MEEPADYGPQYPVLGPGLVIKEDKNNMSDIMTPIPFGKLMNWILEENKKGAVFGIKRPFIADPDKTYEIFGRKLETPFGPAAGPHTQLTQNIVASYVAGSRFFELKTVQKLDGEDLPVSKPCIKADDECYNCEWSTELYVPQAFDEYVKAWFACKVLAKEYGLGSPDGFQFNMSVGYDLDGIKTEKIDRFIEGMKDASETAIFKECRQWLLDNLDRFEKVSREDVEAISPNVCNCATLSTLHGCPPQEIERIARYLIEEKKVHTFIKCNPTLLGYEYARKIMDDMGYDYVAFGDFHFKDDLQYSGCGSHAPEAPGPGGREGSGIRREDHQHLPGRRKTERASQRGDVYVRQVPLSAVHVRCQECWLRTLEGSCAFPIPAALTSLTSRISWMQASGR